MQFDVVEPAHAPQVATPHDAEQSRAAAELQPAIAAREAAQDAWTDAVLAARRNPTLDAAVPGLFARYRLAREAEEAIRARHTTAALRCQEWRARQALEVA